MSTRPLIAGLSVLAMEPLHFTGSQMAQRSYELNIDHPKYRSEISITLIFHVESQHAISRNSSLVQKYELYLRASLSVTNYSNRMEFSYTNWLAPLQSPTF